MRRLRLVYFSKGRDNLDRNQIDEIVAVSNRNNAAAGLTGLLLYLEGVFVQVLEGPEDQVRALLSRLRSDNRHSDIHIVYEEEAENRYFDTWSMAYLETDLDDLLETADLPSPEAALALFAADGNHTPGDNGLSKAIARAMRGFARRIAAQGSNPVAAQNMARESIDYHGVC